MSTTPTNKIAVYTAIFGGYEGLIPQPRLPGVDFICFTDGNVRARPWKVVHVAPQFESPTRDARRCKLLPHRLLKDYEISVWMDANYLVVGDVRKLVRGALRSSNMAIFDHNQTALDPRDCVYDEYEAIMNLHTENKAWKDDPEIMRAQIERYRGDGYPAHNGLIFTAVLIRRHHAPDVVRTMERWWDELSRGSRRDQLSFNYAAWKESFSYAVIDGDLRDSPWFYMLGGHRKSYRGKLFRYRLRRRLGLVRHGRAGPG